ncbi:MAG TPA: energy transducer TonB [Bacteroidales bacterium]|nr:energy transducer TonB [Bacteroidales bacterium]
MAENFDINTAKNLDEIVFQKRNKEYGAYYLRKAYKKFMTRSVIISVAVLLLAVGIPFFIFKQTYSANQEQEVAVDMMNMNAPKDENAPPPPPPPPEATVEQKAKFTAPIVVTDTTETTEINQDDLNKTTSNVVVVEEEVVVEEDNSEKVIEEVVETPIFTVVEEMPSFPGGDESRIKFLTENIKYPQMAKESGIQGTVYVTFVVDEKGKVADVRVLRGIGGGCDEEAVRVVKLMPPWNAGKQSGKPVRVQFNMPIRFTLN